MNLKLQTEIIRHILSNFGINLKGQIPDPNGFMGERFRLERRVTFDDGENQVAAPTWASQLDLAGSLIRCIICDLSVESLHEFALVFRMGDLPSYGIRLSDDPDDAGTMRHNLTEGVWTSANTFIQASALAGFEQVSMFPIAWKPIENTTELFELLVDFLKNGAD